MSNLREKFRMYIDIYNEEDASEQCEQITDDFSVSLIDWMYSNSIYIGNGKYRVIQNENYFNSQELQQYFKDNIYEI